MNRGRFARGGLSDAVLLLHALLGLALAKPDLHLSERTHRVGGREVVTVTARDGVDLRTVVILPKGEGPFPAVVTRTPYPMGVVLGQQCRILARRGYACLWQEVRGRMRSGGEWIPFLNDERDGQDTIAWIREQPWSNGTIAWLGDSYLAATGWTVALEDPDGLTTLVSRIFAPPLHRSAYESGLLRHDIATAWMSRMPSRKNGPILGGGAYHRALDHRPRTTADEAGVGFPVTWYRQWITAEDPADPFWLTGDPARFERAAETTDIPVLFVGGWSDAFVEAQFDAWSRRAGEHDDLMVIGPWAHLGQRPASFPMRKAGQMPQLPRVVDWLDTHVKGSEPRYEAGGVLTYVVGGNRWEHRPDWPPETVERRLGVVPGQGRCDGRLLPDAPALSEPLTWTYDPEDPYPSKGGAGLLAGAIPTMNGVQPGFVKVPNRCRRRDDVWRFVSEPLERDLHLAGTVRVELEVASDAPDTAFGFRLLWRRPGGKEVFLREGFATLALRDGPPRAPYTPGQRVLLLPDGQPLEVELQAGSSLVLVLTSSSFPAVEAHPNVAGVLAEATETRPAHQQVFAATLVLPEVR